MLDARVVFVAPCHRRAVKPFRQCRINDIMKKIKCASLRREYIYIELSFFFRLFRGADSHIVVMKSRLKSYLTPLNDLLFLLYCLMFISFKGDVFRSFLESSFYFWVTATMSLHAVLLRKRISFLILSETPCLFKPPPLLNTQCPLIGQLSHA